MAKPTKTEIVKAIRLMWDSLESHLDPSISSKELCRACGDVHFHAKCAIEYAFIIDVLTRCL